MQDSALTFGARALSIGIGLATSVLLYRTLGPSLVGSYGVTLLVVSVVVMLGRLGLGSANVYYGSRYPGRIPTLAGNSLLAAGLLGAVCAALAIGVSLVPAFQRYLAGNGVDPAWVRALALFCPAFLLGEYMSELVRARGRIHTYNLLKVARSAVMLTAVAGFVYLAGWGVRGGLFAWVTTEVIACVAAVCLGLAGLGRRIALSASQARASLYYGIRLHPGTIAQFLNYRLDVFMVSYFLAPEDVGFYLAAGALAERLWEMPHAIRTVLFYRVAQYEDPREAAHLTARACRVLLLVAAPLCATMAALSCTILWVLWGIEFLPAAPALALLMPGILAFSVSKLLCVHMAGAGRPEVPAITALVSAVCTVTLDLLLIPLLGIAGAAIASSAAYALATAFVTVVFVRSADVTLAELFVARRQDILLLRGFLSDWLSRAGSWARRFIAR